MNAARAVLVTGATGLVGRRLVASLRGDGRAVRIVSRSVAPEGFDTGVEVVSWNGRDLPREALAGVGALVHLAGEPVFGPLPTAAHMRRVRTSRVESTEALVAALGALPANERPECFVCASAVGYYGSRGDAQLDETRRARRRPARRGVHRVGARRARRRAARHPHRAAADRNRARARGRRAAADRAGLPRRSRRPARRRPPVVPVDRHRRSDRARARRRSTTRAGRAR
jgi:nucleoside-diphosphate-sugar epimerase